jgi:hypothetical protein
MAILLYLSGGAANTSAVASLGGARSVTPAPQLLFGQISSATYAAGVTYYCCLYAVSTTATSNINVYVKEDTTSTLTSLAVGWGTSAANATEPTIGARTTAPSGVTFFSPNTANTAVAGGALTANQHKALWVRFVASATVSPPTTESFILTLDNPPVVGQNDAVRLLTANKWANVTIAPTPTTGNNTDRYLRGGDFNTPIWATSGTTSWWELFISGNSNPATVTTYGETTFPTVTVRGGETQKVLSCSIKADAPGTTVEQIRITEYQGQGLASTTKREPVFYQMMYVKFDERTLTRARRVGGSNFYQIFWEAKCEPDFRLRGQLQYDSTLDKLYWVSHTDVLSNANRIHNGENKSVNVVLSSTDSATGWHKIEVWCNRPQQTFRMAVDGSDIINLTSSNLYGTSGNILNFPMFTQLYATTSMSGPASEKPIQMWVDDFELWTKPPATAWGATGPQYTPANLGNFLMIGDSLYRGNTSSLPNFYSPAQTLRTSLLAGGHTVTFVGHHLADPGSVPVGANGGWTLTNLNAEMSNFAAANPDTVALQIGTNFLGTDVSATVGTDMTNTLNTLNTTLGSGIRYYITAPVNLSWFHQASWTALKTAMQNWCALDSTNRFFGDLTLSGVGTGSGSNFIGDGTHWSSAGANVVAAYLDTLVDNSFIPSGSPPPAGTGPVLVGAPIFASSAGSVTALQSTVWSNAATNTIVVAVRWEETTTTAVVTDVAGNTYTAGPLISHPSGNQHTRLFYKINATANASNRVTLTLGAAKTYVSMCVTEWNPAATLTFVQHTTATATDNTITAPTLTATGAGLVVASLVSWNAQPAWTVTSGYTKVDIPVSGSIYHALLYKVITGAGSEAPGMASGGGSDLAISAMYFSDT